MNTVIDPLHCVFILHPCTTVDGEHLGGELTAQERKYGPNPRSQDINELIHLIERSPYFAWKDRRPVRLMHEYDHDMTLKLKSLWEEGYLSIVSYIPRNSPRRKSSRTAYGTDYDLDWDAVEVSLSTRAFSSLVLQRVEKLSFAFEPSVLKDHRISKENGRQTWNALMSTDGEYKTFGCYPFGHNAWSNPKLVEKSMVFNSTFVGDTVTSRVFDYTNARLHDQFKKDGLLK